MVHQCRALDHLAEVNQTPDAAQDPEVLLTRQPCSVEGIEDLLNQWVGAFRGKIGFRKALRVALHQAWAPK
jgi:hypothetical protein